MAEAIGTAVGTNILTAGMVSDSVGDVEASATDPRGLGSRLGAAKRDTCHLTSAAGPKQRPG